MATVYLNASTGNDSNTYVQAQNPATPWLTLGKCQTSATSGDTISLAAGTYTLASVAFTKTFTIVGPSPVAGFPTAILDGGNASITFTYSLNLTLQNLTIQNIISTATNNNAIIAPSASSTTLTAINCVFRNITVFRDGDATHAQGTVGQFNVASSTFSFTNCLFYNLVGTTGGVGGAILYSRFVACTINLTGCVFSLTTGGTTQIANMLAQYSGGTSTVTVKNCIFYNGTGGTVTFALNISPTVTYSDGYLLTSFTAGTGNISSDPLFIDTVNANFNPRPTSPCVDTGVVP